MVPRSSFWESFRCFFREHLREMMVFLWNDFVPRFLLFLSCLLGQLGSYHCFSNHGATPEFISVFPFRDGSDLLRHLISLLSRKTDFEGPFNCCHFPINFWIKAF